MRTAGWVAWSSCVSAGGRSGRRAADAANLSSFDFQTKYGRKALDRLVQSIRMRSLGLGQPKNLVKAVLGEEAIRRATMGDGDGGSGDGGGGSSSGGGGGGSDMQGLAEAWREVTYDGGRAAGDALVERCVGGDCK